MGLDMYLTRRIYIGGHFEHLKAEGGVKISTIHETFDIPANQVDEVVLFAGYWRKANAIHRWFVGNCQNGVDECQESYVEREQLAELKALCVEALASKDASLLPPTEGFFFGSTDIDDWYWKYLQDTIAIIDALPPEGEVYYHSSW